MSAMSSTPNFNEKYQLYKAFIGSEKQTAYFQALKRFYDKKFTCPACKNPVVIRTIANNIITIKCQDPKCDWKLVINKPEYTNLFHQLFLNKETEMRTLYQLIYTEDFSQVKSEYLKHRQEIEDIRTILEKQNEKISEFYQEKLKIFGELLHTYNQRQVIFARLGKDFRLNSEVKENLMEIYKNELPLNEQRLKAISKQFKIEIANLKTVIEWISYCEKYIRLQMALRNVIAEEEKYVESVQKINQNMMVRLPEIIETGTAKKKETSPPTAPTKIKIKTRPKPVVPIPEPVEETKPAEPVEPVEPVKPAEITIKEINIPTEKMEGGPLVPTRKRIRIKKGKK